MTRESVKSMRKVEEIEKGCSKEWRWAWNMERKTRNGEVWKEKSDKDIETDDPAAGSHVCFYSVFR